MDEVMNVTVDTTVPENIDELSEEQKLDLFTKKYMTAFMKIREINELSKQLEDSLKDIKENLGVMMDKYGIKSVKNSLIGITRVGASSSVSLDTARLKKEDPELFEQIFKRFNKTTNKKAYTKIET